MLRLAAFAALLVVLCGVALFLIANFVRRTSMFFPERYPIGDWRTSNLPVVPRDVVFQADDGVHLHGWLFDAGRGTPLLIWFHGNAGNLTGRAPAAAELARRGITVFVFDYRGFGRSEGTPSEQGALRDSVAAYDAVAGHEPKKRIIALYGESLGGPFAAWTANRRRADCVVIENSFPSLASLGNALYHPLPLGLFTTGALTTTRWLNRAGLPVLVMHGRNDQVIPFHLGMELYEGLRVRRKLLVSETAGHCEMPYVDGERYYRTVVEFVRGGERNPEVRAQNAD
jgi:fermentation-respiration switch protein FrsA (DUF1100 family)